VNTDILEEIGSCIEIIMNDTKNSTQLISICSHHDC